MKTRHHAIKMCGNDIVIFCANTTQEIRPTSEQDLV